MARYRQRELCVVYLISTGGLTLVNIFTFVLKWDAVVDVRNCFQTCLTLDVFLFSFLFYSCLVICLHISCSPGLSRLDRHIDTPHIVSAYTRKCALLFLSLRNVSGCLLMPQMLCWILAPLSAGLNQCHNPKMTVPDLSGNGVVFVGSQIQEWE